MKRFRVYLKGSEPQKYFDGDLAHHGETYVTLHTVENDKIVSTKRFPVMNVSDTTDNDPQPDKGGKYA